MIFAPMNEARSCFFSLFLNATPPTLSLMALAIKMAIKRQNLFAASLTVYAIHISRIKWRPFA